MLAWFRRQRLLAALLIAVNPALVGSWVAAYHPCPVSDGAQWRRGEEAQVVTTASEHAGHDMSMMEEAPAPSDQAPAHDHSNSDGHCTCIGQCLIAGIALPLDAGRESQVALEITQHPAPRTQNVAAFWASTPRELLPPSTAPPIA